MLFSFILYLIKYFPELGGFYINRFILFNIKNVEAHIYIKF